MSKKQINPKLISALTGKELDSISPSPVNKDLGGKYVKMIIDRKSKITPIFGKNEIMMKCKRCGQKGKYDVGFISIDIPEKKEDIDNTIRQMTGYFRCTHCNAGGEWEDSDEVLMLSIMTLMDPDEFSDLCQIGKMQLYDGTSHQYATDGEEHLLQKIAKDPNDGFIWNRLGNLYQKGGRPELAMAAFEKSIEIDPKQMESHYSIGTLLSEVNDNQHAMHHFHQMMLAAEDYKQMDAENLRELLSFGLHSAFDIFIHSNGKIPLFPTTDDLLSFGKELDGETYTLDFEIHPDDLTSFYPIAESFMGKRVNEIPKKKRIKTAASLFKGKSK